MPMIFPEYESFDGIGLANLIRRGVLSPEEILEAAIQRVELFNPTLNAVICKLYDKAKASIQAGLPAGPFYGVPLLLKDLLGDYQGMPICFGSRFAYNHQWVSPYTSELVRRLIASGVIIFGKTNVPEFGLSPFTEPELFGPTHNPWDVNRSCGGSSGGAGTAVAARLVPIAHGGDGGGSLRIPAAYTGVFGLKPSRGRTPIGPMFTRVWLGMVTEHVLTRSVRDSAAMLDALSGPEPGSPIALPTPQTSFMSQLDESLPSLRIGLIEKPFFKADVDPEYVAIVKKAGQLCQELGHQVEVAQLEIEEDLAFAFLIIMAAENANSLQTLIKAIGHKPKYDELENITATICHAGEEFSAADYAWAVQKIDEAGQKLANFFHHYDVLLSLTMPFPAPLIGENKPNRNEQIGIKLLRHLHYGPNLRHLMQRAAEKNFSFMAFTALFNIGGQPAMSVPLYWDKQNMPVGIQFAAAWQKDGLLLQLAKQLEAARPWEDKLPDFSNQKVETPLQSM